MSSDYSPFSLSVTRDAAEVVIAVAGELDLASADELAHAITRVRAAGSSRVVLDLRGVDFIDSTGLRVLLSLRNDVKRCRSALTLLPPPPSVQRIFEITGTRGLFDWQTG